MSTRNALLALLAAVAPGCSLYFNEGGSGYSPIDTSADGGATSADGAAGSGLAPDFAWYLLDETSGTTAHDSSPDHYDITNLDGVVWGGGAGFDSTVGVCGTATV